MQNVSQSFLDAINGSFQAVGLVDAWYDGSLVRANMPLTSGQVDVDTTRAILTSATGTFVSPDGSLTPSAYNAPLGTFGTELNLRAGVQYPDGSVELVSIGWFHLDTADVGEAWRQYHDAQTNTMQWGQVGSQVQARGSDRMWYVDKARFLGSPEQPASLASVRAEITRLLQNIVPVGDLTNITDAAIPKSIAYQASRVDAIQSLANVIGASVRMSPNGAAVLKPIDPGSSVWTVTAGVNGTDADWSKSLSSEDLYNAVITTGQAPDGTALVGVAQETAGPLRYGGPFGQVPYEHNNPLLSTQSAAALDAQTTLDRLIRQRVVPVTVTCPPNYALEGGDVVTIVLPDRTLTGPVTKITWTMPGKAMTMVVNVPRSQVWT